MALSKKLQDRVAHHTKKAFQYLDEADETVISGTGRYPASNLAEMARAHIDMLLLLKEMEQ